MINIRTLADRLMSTREKKVLLENFLSLSFLQAANYILPLITLPYLVRVLGPEKFGLIAFAQALIQYFVIFTDYGFNFSATRQISINRNDPAKVTDIFNSVMMIKIGFLAISFIFLIGLVFCLPKFNDYPMVYIWTFGAVIGNALFPTWFFQGMERMKYITFLNILGKLIFTVAIFIFVRRQQDFLNVPIITSFGFVTTGLAGLWIVFRNFGVRLTMPRYADIRRQLGEGWHTFLSTMSITLYTNTNTFALGLFTNNTIVGYYSAAEKLITAVQKLSAAISQSVYPYISKISAESKEKAAAFIRKLTKIVGSSFFVVSAAILILAAPIVRIVLGPEYGQSITVLRIMAFLPFIIAMSNIYAVQGLFALGHQRVVSSYITVAAILYVPLMTIMTYKYGYIGTAISVLFMEMVITVLSRYYYLKLRA